MYAELKELAEQRSSEKRLDLLRKLADMFFDGIDEHTEAETSLFNDVMGTIVDQVSRDAKIDIATNLAILPGFPLPVVRKLANDSDIVIARPVIRGASGLTDFDLIEIARRASDEHLDALAARPQLSKAITDVLIDRGSRHVMHTISTNHGARFSEWGMDVLVDRASDDGQLQNALVERSDLPQKAVNALASIVSETLVIKLIERGYQVQGKIPDELVKQASRRFALAVRERDQKMLAAERIISEFGSGRLRFEDALLQIVECEQMLAVAAMLDYRTGLDRHTLMSILNGGVTQTVMVLLRGLDLTWNTASAILALRSQKLQPHQPCDARPEAFEAINIAVAKRTIRFLVVRARTTAESMMERPEMAAATRMLAQ
jgi:uncharacterized protein (DUF2336 family)